MKLRGHRLGRYLAALTLMSLLAGCGARGGAAPIQEPPAVTKAAEQVDARVIAANVRYSLDLLHARWDEQPGTNHFLSPASAQLVLALTANGARGETQSAMTGALALNDLPLADVNREMGALQSVLAKPDPKVEVSIANAVWYKEGYQVSDAFAGIARDKYRAVFAPAPFGQPAAAQAINDWTAKATKGRIPTIVERTDARDRMYLVNAIYFKADWQVPFDHNATHKELFHKLDGSLMEMPFMTQHRTFRYLQGENFQAVALPYGAGRLSMYVFLPSAGVQPGDFYASITPERWTQWMQQFSDKEGTLLLPKLKLEYGADLIPAMTRLGMGIAFDRNKADFGELLANDPEPLYIALLVQKTFLQMDEKGTEAAAATVVGVESGSARPQPKEPFNMVVNRPYFLAIRDDRTGALLFVGAIVEPKAP